MNETIRDQMQRLTPEQQETLATLEANRIKKRQALFEKASHYRGQLWFPPFAIGVGCLAGVFTTHHQTILPYLVGIILCFLIQFHAAGVNRRLDALMEFFRTDLA